jgi:uncharacterized protein YbjT (DUF2867 family)
MAAKKIIAVIGATGAQGGGLVKAITKDPKKEFSVRAITRNKTSEKAQSLANRGVEIAEADIADKTSLIRAFSGAYGAYCVTFFWDHFSVDQEMAHARNMAVAAKEAGLRHVIWSTLEDTRVWIPPEDNRMPTLQGKYKVPHFDGKGASDTYFIESGVPYTLLLTSFFWENFIYFGMAPQKSPDGELAITLPMGTKKLPGIAVDDIGRCALGIFKAGKRYQKKKIGIAGEHLGGQDMADVFAKVYGKPVKYNQISPEVYRSFDFPGADDLGNMFQFKSEFEEVYCGARDPAIARKLNPELMDFETWVRTYKDKIPVE